MPDTADWTVIHDPARLRVVASVRLDDPGMRAELDAVAERLAEDTDMPIAMASVVLGLAQTHAGAFGLPNWIVQTGGIPAEWSFCTRMVEAGGAYVVPDARNDAVESRNPMVTVQGVGAYAGVPVVIDGQTVGAACVLGEQAHDFTDADLRILHEAATEITEIINRHRDT